MISWCKNTYILWGKTRDFPYNSEKNPYFGFSDEWFTWSTTT